ncbi:MAG: excalibur calcium-binding domain-containing protein [Bryobacterales bacterium]|nr:excalibur calcium-binding domain-containing protein [Bryobacterales bacterium]
MDFGLVIFKKESPHESHPPGPHRLAVPLLALAAPGQESPQPVETFRNCSLMREAGWTRGVNQNGGTYREAWNKAEKRTYALNTGRDRDKDGHACE